MEEVGNYIQKLSQSGMPLFPNIDLENHLRKVAGLPLTCEDDPAREAQKEREANAARAVDNNNGTSKKPTKADEEEE